MSGKIISSDYDINLSKNPRFSYVKVALANKSFIELEWEYLDAFDVFKISKQNRDTWETVYW